MAEQLKLGVRELVEFCCRGGDLGFNNSPGVKALEGLLTHQKIQRRYQTQAKSEVAVKRLLHFDDMEIEVGGRIDLLFADESPQRIEEIKTVYSHATGNEEDAVYWAQLKCYGACYAHEHRLDKVNLCLNLVNLFSREEQRHSRIYSRDDLETFLESTLRQYLHWQRLVEAQRQRTRQQAREMSIGNV